MIMLTLWCGCCCCFGAAAVQGELGDLPVYGVGHSMGSLLHMLINARYAVKVCSAVQQLLLFWSSLRKCLGSMPTGAMCVC
jgi:hypothetical protein